MKILYQIPSLTTIYAGRTIYNGYKNAFLDLGHEFRPYTADDDFVSMMEQYQPDVLITGLSNYSLKYLDLDLLRKYRRKGLKVAVNVPFWTSPMSKMRINETSGIKGNKTFVELIKDCSFGDVFFNSCEQFDERMAGFEKGTGQPYYTIPLAADKTIIKESYDEKFAADVSYIGTNLPEKRQFFQQYVFPLGRKHDLKLYGQDWTMLDRGLGWVQRLGQYFNISPLSKIRKPKLQLDDEAKIYTSSVVSINVHEDYQKRFGGDCNERTFKIPLAGGFEVTDDVACIRKYFKPDKEIVIAKDKSDWMEKVEYYLKNPEKRTEIIRAGQRKVLECHTYHNRAKDIISLLG